MEGHRAPTREQMRLLKNASVRLKTFRNWPNTTTVTKSSLAEAGFFFFNDRHRVQCTFCLVIIGDWRNGDDAMTKHRDRNAGCPFILGLPVGNITLAATASNAVVSSPSTSTLRRPFGSGTGGIKIRMTAEPEKGENWKPLSVYQLGRTGIVAPMFMAYEKRLKTYDSWPKLVQTRESMASAGLYYSGLGDKVRCFHCGGGIKGWEKDDDPMKEHARLYSGCPFVRNNFKGNEKELDELNRKKMKASRKRKMTAE